MARMENNTRYFAWPYNFKETLSWCLNNIFGPSKKFRQLSNYIPKSLILNEIIPELKLVFLGDIMPPGNRTLEIHESVLNFVADADYLIGNFEGVIVNKKAKRAFLSQAHSPHILDKLAELKDPNKIVLSCSNNHSGDFGHKYFSASCNLMKEKGFQTIGAIDNPNVILNNKVNLVSATSWSNQKCSYIATFDNSLKLIDKSSKFNLLFPHWGYEMQAYPNPQQLYLAHDLLSTWDAIIGHHSHCPQPVTMHTFDKTNKLLAFSLGNFSTWVFLQKYSSGIILKIEIGQNKRGTWLVGKIDWDFIKIRNTFQTCSISIS